MNQPQDWYTDIPSLPQWPEDAGCRKLATFILTPEVIPTNYANNLQLGIPDYDSRATRQAFTHLYVMMVLGKHLHPDKKKYIQPLINRVIQFATTNRSDKTKAWYEELVAKYTIPYLYSECTRKIKLARELAQN